MTDLEGFKVISQFDIENFECARLDSAIGQIAILLYPSEQYNEKFLLKIRNCVLSLKKDHLLKKWLEQISQKKIFSKTEANKMEFLEQIFNSPFNLITDQKIKKEVIQLIADIKGKTSIEKVVKSYLFLMIGNLTQSDNIIKSLLSKSPREFYTASADIHSIYHDLGILHLERILEKLSKHPADRITYALFLEYLKSYTNSPTLLKTIDSLDMSDHKKRFDLKYTENIAPEFLSYLRMKESTSNEKISAIQKNKYSFEFLAYWIYPFLNVEYHTQFDINQSIKKLSQDDILWFSYLVMDEKIADSSIKNDVMNPDKMRKELRLQLQHKAEFMLVLYRLLQIGDIDKTLVESIMNYKKNE